MSTQQAPETTSDHDENLTVIVKKSVLQQVIDQLDTIVKEAVFQLGHDGLHVEAIDPANVGMARVKLDSDAFEHVGDGKYSFGIDLQRLDDYLGNADPSDLVEIAFDPETRMLHIQHTTVEVDMAGIDPESVRRSQGLPDVDWACSFATEASELKDAVDHADLVSDQGSFAADPEEEVLRIVGDGDMDTIETELGREELVDAKFSEDSVSLFSLEYLAGSGAMLDPVPSDAVVEGLLDTEMPIRLEYEFADGHGRGTLAVAPRIQSD